MANEDGGTKYDHGKPAYHLIDAEFDRQLLTPAWARTPQDSQAQEYLRRWAHQGDDCLAQAFWATVHMYSTDNPLHTARLELARVLQVGAEKYDDNNWRGGFSWSRLWRAAYGHIESHNSGDVYDHETGFLHLSHALCCLMFLIVHERDGLGEDDRGEIWPREKPAAVPDANFVKAVPTLVSGGGEYIFELEDLTEDEAVFARGVSKFVITRTGTASTESLDGRAFDVFMGLADQARKLAWPNDA